MKKVLYFLMFWMLSGQLVKAQFHDENYPVPEPVLLEAMAGNRWGMFQSIIAKKFSPNSKFNFFNLTNYEVDYKKENPSIYIVQAIAYYEPVKGFNMGLGANLKTFNGFKPLLALSYLYNTQNISLIVQPSIELHKDGVGELFALFEYRGTKNRKFEPYFSIQSATSYLEKNGNHDFTYINSRLGLQYKNFRFGPAVNMRIMGKEGIYQGNYGAFVGVLIY
ncbi:hypothetical protein ACQWU4_04560 [Chryseobacterium sp. MIQD13]|uniref:hypothetical protein n=1 Tax=Chryseobacterium sp. MIQD13 TaxID=3422310 RepID=UPI003D26D1F7